MKNKDKQIGIHKLYAQDPEAADKLLWDREVDPITRRGFLKKSSLFAMVGVVGATIPFFTDALISSGSCGPASM